MLQIRDKLRSVFNMRFSPSLQNRPISAPGIDILDEGLAEEMTFLYYLNLLGDNYILPEYSWIDASTSLENYDISHFAATSSGPIADS